MLLKVGSKGDDVKKLQAKLGLAADGHFGPGTEAKVKAWQAANGLTADGLVGDGSWAKMFGSDAPAAPAAPVASVAPSDFKLANLKGHIPDSVIAQIPDTAAKFGITTPLRLAHFLAQASHESGGFKAVNENLNYSADGLKKIFPKYFPGNLNESYARQPQKIANRVYASRMGNGDETSGDGYRYKGAGFIQLTGKSNYSAFDKFVDDDILVNGRSMRETAKIKIMTQTRITEFIKLLIPENESDTLADLSYEEIEAEFPMTVQITLIEKIAEVISPTYKESRGN